MREKAGFRYRPVAIALIFLFSVFWLQAFPENAEAGQTRFLEYAAKIRLRGAFTFNPVYPAPGQPVQFMDTSTGTPTSWQWDFGDGTTSALQNPTHTYAGKGFYRVSLTVSDGSLARSVRRSVTVMDAAGLTASFVYNPAYPAPGQSVRFTDASAGAPTSWHWDFGDGMTSTQQSPEHAFASRGFFRVILTVRNDRGVKSAQRTITVTGNSTPVAAFSFSPSSPSPGQAVQFADASTGGPTSWRWDFGDGSTSNAQNPSHAFATAGPKTVTLNISNSSGSASTSQTVMVLTPLTASFSFTPQYPTPGLTIQFVDTSTGSPTSWHWDFGDGSTSSAQNPSHVFAAPGPKTVILTVSNSTGSTSASRAVVILAALAASFEYSPASPAVGQAVQFSDMSTGGPTSWLWNFGDGTTSRVQNPSHAFATAGPKNVTLTIANAAGSTSSSLTVSVGDALAASFSYSPASPVAGQVVHFVDASAGNPVSWSWNFNDGSVSTLQNPSHTFASAGAYTVILTVVGGNGSASTSQLISVQPVTALNASFAFSPASPALGQPVQFTDSSTGGPTSWRWDFGDGSTSNAQNPSHAYETAGSKTVTLTIGNSSSSANTSQVLTVVSAPNASFRYDPSSPAPGQTVQFTDTSTGNPTSWRWDFGDGSTSNDQNPRHAFGASGPRTVTLTATNGSGSSSASLTVTVVTILAASFRYSPEAPLAGQSVQFTDTSTGNPSTWEWDFGDGATTVAQNPVHSYPSAGSYNVSLTVRIASDSNTVTRTVTVLPSITASFAFTPPAPAPGQSVQFTDTSAGAPTTWLWDFNDGTTSTIQNPSHAFSVAGSFIVNLTVTGSSGSSTASRVITVQPSSRLSASFTFSPASPALGQMVQFTDTSTGNATSWQWNFGDGSTSATRNPSHLYTEAGQKTVNLTVSDGSESSSAIRTIIVSSGEAIIADHTSTDLASIPDSWIGQAKQKLHIAYGTASHGLQVYYGSVSLNLWEGTGKYAFNNGGADGALDFRVWPTAPYFGGLNIAISLDLGASTTYNNTAWEEATRIYLDTHPEVNVVMWAWCYGADSSESSIDLYLALMSGLERDYPNVKFIYQTGHTNGTGLTGNLHLRNNQIRAYCAANNKILYDFEDIESWNPDGVYFGDKNCNANCDYTGGNWAIEWQAAHPGQWFACDQCYGCHSQPLNCNLKARAAWWLWARLAGWDGN